MFPRVNDSVDGVVLAGGLSSRMGRDKARLEAHGELLYVRAARRLIEAGCGRVKVIQRFPLEPHPLIAGFWTDSFGGQGPLDGLLTALERSSAPVVTVLGVDLPMVTADSLRRSRNLLAEGIDVDVVVLGNVMGRQALASSWRRERALGPVRRFFEGGGRSIHRCLEALRVEDLEVSERELMNLNSPEQLSELRNE